MGVCTSSQHCLGSLYIPLCGVTLRWTISINSGTVLSARSHFHRPVHIWSPIVCWAAVLMFHGWHCWSWARIITQYDPGTRSGRPDIIHSPRRAADIISKLSDLVTESLNISRTANQSLEAAQRSLKLSASAAKWQSTSFENVLIAKKMPCRAVQLQSFEGHRETGFGDK